MNGSWAGAMGQTQFIPTTFEAYAVDFDGDGQRNIWTSAADALASAANYLNKAGWQSGKTWGYEVKLPAGFNTGKSSERSLASWMKLGVRRVDGSGFPAAGRHGQPVSAERNAMGRSSCSSRTFGSSSATIRPTPMPWRSATSPTGCAAADRSWPSWPAHEKPFTLEEGKRLQLLLTMHGFYDGDIDGDIGSGSHAAIRDFQRSVGLNPDGVETRDLLQRLEAAR